MRRPGGVSVLLLIAATAAIVLPAHGQRAGGSHGFSSRGGGSFRSGNGGFHGSFSGAPTRSFVGAPPSGMNVPRYTWRGVVNSPTTSGRSFPGNFARTPYHPVSRGEGSASHRQSYHRDRDHRGLDIRPYYNGAYLVPNWIGPGQWGYQDSFGYGDNPDSDAGPAPNAGYADYGPPPPNERFDSSSPSDGAPPETVRAPRQAYSPSEPLNVSASTEDRPSLTVIFWDMRPDQHVQNYLLTRNTLYVFDGGRRREFPLVDIDVVATQQANQEAGIDFSVPVAAR